MARETKAMVYFMPEQEHLVYERFKTGIIVHSSTSAKSLTNHIETVVGALVNATIIDPDHTRLGRFFYYRDSNSEWNQIEFECNPGMDISVDWVGGGPISHNEMLFIIQNVVNNRDCLGNPNPPVSVLGW